MVPSVSAPRTPPSCRHAGLFKQFASLERLQHFPSRPRLRTEAPRQSRKVNLQSTSIRLDRRILPNRESRLGHSHISIVERVAVCQVL